MNSEHVARMGPAAAIDSGQRVGAMSGEAQSIHALEAEIKGLNGADEILRADFP